ncbi:TPA: cell-envelope stress modulator CpxP, partial [Kluyvera ascorbata]|nr:cell-envelope stress modulator CpxP [Kluyvera ascorbata]
AALNENHQQRMEQLRDVARMQQGSVPSQNLFSSNTRSNQ